jgi:hypothetical protein
MSIMNTNRQDSVKKAAAIHRDNIQKSLQHRIEVARASGNENLLRILEAEASYFK